jgi:hypothetical protein
MYLRLFFRQKYAEQNVDKEDAHKSFENIVMLKYFESTQNKNFQGKNWSILNSRNSGYYCLETYACCLLLKKINIK